MSFVVLLLVFTGGGALVARLSGQDFGRSLPFFLLCCVFGLYLLGLAGLLQLGMWLVLLAALCGLALLAASAARAKSLRTIMSFFTSAPFIGFALLLLFVFVINQNRNMTWTDEFSFWGLSVKETVRLNAFYNRPGSAVTTHRDYPPAIMLFQYLWCRLSGGFTEVSAYRSLQFFTLALLLPVFSSIGTKKWRNLFGLLGLVVFVHTLSGVNLYYSVYIDATLGVLIGYVFSLIVARPKAALFDLLNIGLVCLVVTLAKQAGIFALVYLVVFGFARFFILWRQGRRAGASPGLKKQMGPTLLLAGSGAAGVVLAKASWALYKAAVGITGATFAVGGASPGAVLAALLGRGDAEQAEIAVRFGASLVGELVCHTPLAGLTYLQMIILITLVAGLVWWRYRSTPQAGELKALAVTLPIGLALYAAGMLYLYLFSFPRGEALELASYTRYMSTGLISATSVLLLCYARLFTQPVILITEKTEKRQQLQKTIPWLPVSCVVMVFFVTASVYLSLLPQRRADDFSHMATPAQEIQTYLDIEQDKLYMVLQDRSLAEYYAVRFYAAPLAIESGFEMPVPGGGDEGDYPPWPEPAAFEEALRSGGFTYVYLANAHDRFTEGYASLFASPGEIQADGLYRVAGEDGPLRLELVAVLQIAR